MATLIDVPATATINLVTGVIVINLDIRPKVPSHASLYKAIADDIAGGDPTPTFTATLGSTSGVRNGDIDLQISLATL